MKLIQKYSVFIYIYITYMKGVIQVLLTTTPIIDSIIKELEEKKNKSNKQKSNRKYYTDKEGNLKFTFKCKK